MMSKYSIKNFLKILPIIFGLFLYSCVPVPGPSTDSKSTKSSFSSTAPTDAGSNIQFKDEYDFDGNDVVLSWKAFTGASPIVNHRVFTYTDINCSTGEINHGLTSSGLNGAVISGLPNGQIYAKIEAINAGAGSAFSQCSTDFIIVDNTAPSVPTTVVLNPTSGSISNDVTPVITGTFALEAGTTFRVFDNVGCFGIPIGTGSVNSSNNYSISNISYASNGSADGVKSFYAVMEDLTGNISTCINLGVSYTIDTTLPVLNTVTLPSNGRYRINSNLNFTLNLSESVTVTGTPRLKLNIGGQIKYASYVSGSGTPNLLFTYIVDVPFDDTDGITLFSPIDLNSGSASITDSGLNALPLNYTVPNTSQIKIDNSIPVPLSVSTASAKTYVFGENIQIRINFSEVVSVTGTPRISTIINSLTKYFTYISGSGSTSLLFEYQVESGLVDYGGLTTSGTIDLNTGTIQDLAANDAHLNLAPEFMANVFVDATVPTITSVTPPAVAVYKVNGILDFVVNTSKNVSIGGNPQIDIDIGGITKKANYYSGTGTSALTFRYIVEPGLVDNDGILLTSPIGLNGGYINDSLGNNLDLTFTLPITTGITIDSILATISSVSPPADQYYHTGDTLSFTLGFSKAVTLTGTPRLVADIGGVQKLLTAPAGGPNVNHVFSYVVESGLNDSNGIQINSSIDLTGSSILDSSGNIINNSITFPSLSNVKIDSIIPSVISISPPIDGRYKDTLDFKIYLSEPAAVTGTPTLDINIGGVSRVASFTGVSGSELSFSYTILGGETDSDGIALLSPLNLSGGAITDVSGNNSSLTFSIPDTSNVLVDTTLPTIGAITKPNDGTYYKNQELVFTMDFGEPVIVTGIPYISMTIAGASSPKANYVSGSGGNILTFKYTVEEGISSTAISISSPLLLNSGSIKDLAGNNATLTFAPPATGAVIVDSSFPNIVSITPPADATYRIGNNLDFTVLFSKTVIVKNLPKLKLDLDGTIVYANYYSGDNTNSLVFRYTVLSGQNDGDGINIVSPLDLNQTGSIKDSVGNDSSLSFSAVSNTIKIDSGIPRILSITPPINAKYHQGDILDFKINLNEKAYVTGVPKLLLGIGNYTANALYYSGSGTNILTFRYLILDQNNDSDGLDIYFPLVLDGGTIKDGTLNNLNLSYSNSNLPLLTIDTLKPKINSITLPPNGTYKQGEELSFIVNLSENVTVSNNPRIILNIGGSLKNADYVSGTGSSILTFKYILENDLVDSDGITIDSLDLGYTKLLDDYENELLTLIFPVNTSGILVDSKGPRISYILPSANNYYSVGQKIQLQVFFDQLTTLTGNPRLLLDVGGLQGYATPLTLGPSQSIIFEYTVSSSDDNDGISISSPIQTNGGTIKDSLGNNMTDLSFALPDLTLLKVDTTAPSIISVTPVANGNYILGSPVDFTVVFSEEVNVIGAPSLTIDVSGVNRNASYLSGSGSKNIIFRLNPTLDDEDLNGVSIVSPINLNSGSIRDGALNNTALNFLNTNFAFVIVDAKSPTVTSIDTILPKTYKLGDQIIINVNVSESVNVVNPPRLQLNIGGVTTEYATFDSNVIPNQLIFKYTVTSSLLDSNGISLPSVIDLNGGSIKDLANNNLNLNLPFLNTTSVLVNSFAPTILSITPPNNGTYVAGNFLDFTVQFNGPVTINGTPKIDININGSIKNAVYIGNGASNANHLFRMTVGSMDDDDDGITVVSPLQLNGATIRDSALNDANLALVSPNTSGVLIESSFPSVVSLVVPPNDRYKVGGVLNFSTNFSEKVVVTGVPRLTINLGGVTKYANLISGSGTTQLNFQYTIAPGDNDIDGIGVTASVDLNGGTIKDIASKNGILNFTVPNLNGIIVDTTDPVISSISFTNRTYKTSENLDFILNFSEAVSISGNPRLTLVLSNGTVYADYISSPTSSQALFRYVIGSNIPGPSGINLSTTLDLFGGTIIDLANNSLNLNLPATNFNGIIIDTIAPSLISFGIPANAYYTLGNNLDFTVNFNKSVTLVGSASLKLKIGGVDKYANAISYGPSSTLTFRYTTLAGDNDNAGIFLESPLILGGGSSIKDSALNDASLTFASPNSTNIKIDTSAPSITSVTAPSNGNYKSGNLIFDVTFDEDIVVTGIPRLTLDIGGATKYANYSSTVNSRKLRFSYTIVNPDLDTDGISITSSIDLNSGTITDGNSNNATLSFTLPILTSVKIDTITPTINGGTITGPLAKNYKAGELLNFSINYSENVLVTGNPTFDILIGDVTKKASYLTGSGTSTLTFQYIVESGLLDNDGITITSGVNELSGSIKDSFGNLAESSFTPPNMATVLVDSNLPRVASIAVPANGTYVNGQSLTFDLTFTKTVTITGTPRIAINIDGVTKYANYIGVIGGFHQFKYNPIETGLNDSNGIELASSIDLNGSGVIRDSNLNDAELLLYPPDLSGVLVNDTSANPSIISINSPINKDYNLGSSLTFQVNFSEAVYLTNESIIGINLTIDSPGGPLVKRANYISGNGTESLYFSYSVEGGLVDSDGIVATMPIDLNVSGTIKDISGNSADLTFAAPNLTGIKVDSLTPIILTVTPPPDKTYNSKETLTFVLNYNKNVIVTGFPYFYADLGGSWKKVYYVSGSGTSSLTFEYKVLANDNDPNGIIYQGPIFSNGGSIKDSFGNLSQNIISNLTLPSVLVEGVLPSINSITSTPGNYKALDTLSFTVVYSESITVVGTPTLKLNIGNEIKEATYVSGSGTTSLVFTYLVPSNLLVDTDGLQIISPLNLNGATMQDAAGNDSVITFTNIQTTVNVDSFAPTVVSLTKPTSGSYKTSDTLYFDVQFNKPVTIIGLPKLQFDLSGTTIDSFLSSEPSTTVKRFSYTVLNGQNDVDGISILSSLDLNTGSIKDSYGNDAVLTLVGAGTTSIKIDSTPPTIQSIISVPANGTYGIGDSLDFDVQFTEPINITGAPQLELLVGTTSLFCELQQVISNSVYRFRGVIAEGMLDADGIDIISPFKVNGATIRDLAGNDLTPFFSTVNLPNVFIDTEKPYVVGISGPSPGTYGNGSLLQFQLTFNEAVLIGGVPKLLVRIQNTFHKASYVSVAGGNVLTFNLYANSELSDLNGIDITGLSMDGGSTIKDIAQNSVNTTIASTNLSSVLVDTKSPTITQIIPPSNGTFDLGSTLNFQVVFNEDIVVSGGNPVLQIDFEGQIKNALFTTMTGTNTMNFSYTIENGVTDYNGIELIPLLNLNGATIKDNYNNAAVLSFTNINTSGIKTKSVPKLLTITPVLNKSYIAGENLEMNLNFSENVFVSGGTPTVRFNIGGVSKVFNYLSGSGTSALKFRYTIVSGDNDSNGIDSVVGSFLLQGATIKDDELNNAIITIAAQNFSGVLVDSLPPTISSMNIPSGRFKEGTQVSVGVTFNEIVLVTGNPLINIQVGGQQKTAIYFTGNNTNTLSFNYIVENGASDSNGVDIVGPINLNGGTIKDVIGLSANLSLSQTNFALAIVDTSPPIGSININNNAIYTNSLATTLNIFALDDSPIEMYITNTVGCNSGGTWESYSATKAWNLSTANSLNYVYAKFRDDLGHVSNCTSASIIHDNTVPGLVISAPSISSTGTLPVSYTLTYSDYSSIVASAGHVILNKTGTANASVSLTGSGNTRLVTLSSFSGVGTIGISISAGSAIDQTGNQTLLTGPSATFTVDAQAPTDPGVAVTFPVSVNGSGSNITLNWATFIDTNQSTLKYRLTTYTNGSCTVGTKIHGITSATNPLTDSTIIRGLGEGTYWATVSGIDIFGNETKSSCSTNSLLVHMSAPLGGGIADPQFTSTVDGDGNAIAITWTAFSDPVLSDHEIITYKDSVNCSINQFSHGFTGSALNNDQGIVNGLTDGIYRVKIRAKNQVNLTSTSLCSSDFIIVDLLSPVDNGANLQFLDVADSDGNNIRVSWNPFSDINLVNHKITLYTDAGCTAGAIGPFATNSATSTDSVVIDGIPDGVYYGKVAAVDGVGRETTSACSTDTIIVDKIAPSVSGSLLIFTNDFSNTGNNISISWPTFTDQNAGTLKYSFKIYKNDNTCAEINRIGTFGPTAATNPSTDGGLINGLTEGDYYGIIVGEDIAGNTVESICSTDKITIDQTAPMVSSLGLSNGQINNPSNLSISLIFDEIVTYTGTLKLDIVVKDNVGVNQNKSLTIASGNNTNTLTFQYSVAASDLDINGINIVTPLNFNGGTLTDRAGNSFEGKFRAQTNYSVGLNGLFSGPVLSIDTSSFHNYGTINSDTIHLFTIRNTGTTSGTLSRVIDNDGQATVWEISSDTCTGGTLANNGTCTIGVRFKATSGNIGQTYRYFLKVLENNDTFITGELKGKVGP